MDTEQSHCPFACICISRSDWLVAQAAQLTHMCPPDSFTSLSLTYFSVSPALLFHYLGFSPAPAFSLTTAWFGPGSHQVGQDAPLSQMLGWQAFLTKAGSIVILELTPLLPWPKAFAPLSPCDFPPTLSPCLHCSFLLNHVSLLLAWPLGSIYQVAVFPKGHRVP